MQPLAVFTLFQTNLFARTFFFLAAFAPSLASTGQTIPLGSLRLTDSTEWRAIHQALVGKQVVAVGEATHGSKEFIQAKSKLFIELFRHEGFKDLAIEMPYSIGLEITDYVNGLTPFAYIDSVLLPAKTLYCKEFFELLEYIKRLNKEQYAGIRIHGIDIDQFYEYALTHIRTVVARKNGIYARTLDSLSADLPKDHKLLSTNFKTFTGRAANASIHAVGEYLQKVATDFSSEERYLIQRSLQQLTDSYEYFNGSAIFRYTRRDKTMAGYVIELRSTIPSGKLMLWAHNEHVRTADAGFQRMGEVLKNSLGGGYFSIGSLFSEGSYRVYYKGALQSMNAAQENAGELALYLYRQEKESCFVVSSQLPASLQNRRVSVHSVGIVQKLDVPKANQETINTTKDYSAYFYFPTVHALDPIK